jgi:hypothetical protein
MVYLGGPKLKVRFAIKAPLAIRLPKGFAKGEAELLVGHLAVPNYLNKQLALV